MKTSNLPICLLLLMTCGAAAGCGERAAQFELLGSGCPSNTTSLAGTVVASEFECAIHCGLDPSCQLSIYLRGSSVCIKSYKILDGGSLTGACYSDILMRRKIVSKSTINSWDSLSFSSQFVLWYDFRKSNDNFVKPSMYSATPVNISEQNSIDGIRLQGSNSSYLMVSTPGFRRYFHYGQKFSFFFVVKFSLGFNKCISAFVDVDTGMYSSAIYASSSSRLFAQIYFPNGTTYSKFVNSSQIPNLVQVQQTLSIGINYEGEDFATPMYLNNSSLSRSSWGRSYGGNVRLLPNIHDTLLIGICMTSGVDPFDGWLRCWGMLTGNLDMGQFQQLQSLCNA